MIQNGIEEILCVTDPHNSAKYWYSFTNKASYLMSYIKKYIEDIRNIEKGLTNIPYRIWTGQGPFGEHTNQWCAN